MKVKHEKRIKDEKVMINNNIKKIRKNTEKKKI